MLGPSRLRSNLTPSQQRWPRQPVDQRLNLRLTAASCSTLFHVVATRCPGLRVWSLDYRGTCGTRPGTGGA